MIWISLSFMFVTGMISFFALMGRGTPGWANFIAGALFGFSSRFR